MRKSLIVAAITLLTGAMLMSTLPQTAFAKAGGHHAGKRLQKLSQTLALTDAQKSQIKPILMNTHEQARAVKADTSLSPAERKAKMKTLRQAMRSQILPILTPAQKLKLAQMRHHKQHAAKSA